MSRTKVVPLRDEEELEVESGPEESSGPAPAVQGERLKYWFPRLYHLIKSLHEQAQCFNSSSDFSFAVFSRILF